MSITKKKISTLQINRGKERDRELTIRFPFLIVVKYIELLIETKILINAKTRVLMYGALLFVI